MANEGYEVYLIELTGGENSECDNCYDYTYEFLTDEVFPSYINYILNDSGSEKVKYVGHSNGARVALDSLTNGVVDSDNIDVLVLVGVPGAFEELSYFASLIDEYGEELIGIWDNAQINHIRFNQVSAGVGILAKSKKDLFTGTTINGYTFFDNEKISTNLFEKYYNWISSINDTQPGVGLNVNYFTLIYGTKGLLFSMDNDLIVNILDSQQIFQNVNNVSNDKKIKDYYITHDGMSNNAYIKRDVESSINKEIYSGEN